MECDGNGPAARLMPGRFGHVPAAKRIHANAGHPRQRGPKAESDPHIVHSINHDARTDHLIGTSPYRVKRPIRPVPGRQTYPLHSIPATRAPNGRIWILRLYGVIQWTPKPLAPRVSAASPYPGSDQPLKPSPSPSPPQCLIWRNPHIIGSRGTPPPVSR